MQPTLVNILKYLNLYSQPTSLKPLVILSHRPSHSRPKSSVCVTLFDFIVACLSALAAMKLAFKTTAPPLTPEQRGLRPLVLPARLASHQPRIPTQERRGLFSRVIGITLNGIAAPLDVIVSAIFNHIKECVEMDAASEGNIITGLCEHANLWILW